MIILTKKFVIGNRRQPIRIQFYGKDGIGYPMLNQLNGKIGIMDPMHQVNNAKAKTGYYCIGI
jgi:hypothetical protein